MLMMIASQCRGGDCKIKKLDFIILSDFELLIQNKHVFFLQNLNSKYISSTAYISKVWVEFNFTFLMGLEQIKIKSSLELET